MLHYVIGYVLWRLRFVMFSFCALYVLYRYTFCDPKYIVTFTCWKFYVLELLRCVQLPLVTLRHVMFTYYDATLCSNIDILIRQ
jgi:hypothetical protein